MQKLDLCDRLIVHLSDRPGIDLECSDETLSGENNLAAIAARRLIAAAEHFPAPGLKIRLDKKIPVSAGLGGGSSDAGAVLKGLNAVLKKPLSRHELVEIATTIGADVAFFAVDDTAVIASGIGECLQPAADLEGFWIVLINPGIRVSTRSIFEKYALTSVSKNSKVASFQNGSVDTFMLEHLCNDLESVTASEYPVIERMKQNLIEAGAEAAMMSGSGPTTFGLFPEAGFDERSIKEIVNQLSSMYGRQVYATRAFTGA